MSLPESFKNMSEEQRKKLANNKPELYATLQENENLRQEVENLSNRVEDLDKKVPERKYSDMSIEDRMAYAKKKRSENNS